VRILGADLLPCPPSPEPRDGTVVLLNDEGGVAASRHPKTVADLAAAVGELVGGEPFLLGIDVAVVAPERPGRARPVETLVARRLGFKLPPSGRPAADGAGPAPAGESLLAALAVAGLPCLPYPDRDLRASGLAEIHPGLSLKVLLWHDSTAAAGPHPAQEEIFRAFAVLPYRRQAGRRSVGWAERAAALDLALRTAGSLPGFDLDPAREALRGASTDPDVERAASLFDACLIAGTARRYLKSPEDCVFLGGRKEGYVILPADGFVRRLALREARPGRAGLFPRGSLREKLGAVADLHSAGLLDVPGRPQNVEAVFRRIPLYEFDNLDEMLWWKHCRHLDGPALPVEGLREIVPLLGRGDEGDGRLSPLRLVRSRHRTLSFRFEPPASWRARVPTRDGKTYAFRVTRAVYETLPSDE
jgi:predicted RNase H-like nuclease